MAATIGALTATAWFGAAPAAHAQFDGMTVDDIVTVSLMSGWRLENGNHMAALNIDLAPGWKTYWRAPGEGGVPTAIHLTQDDGIEAMSIHWPSPQVFETNGMQSIGYVGNVILPLEFEISAGEDVPIAGEVHLGVCLDVCIPIAVSVTAILPSDSDREAMIGAAMAQRPFTAAEAGAGQATCRMEPISDGMRVTVTADMPPMGADEAMVVEHVDPAIWVSEAQTNRVGNTVTGTVDVVPPHHGAFALSRADLRITVVGTEMTVELEHCTG